MVCIFPESGLGVRIRQQASLVLLVASCVMTFLIDDHAQRKSNSSYILN